MFMPTILTLVRRLPFSYEGSVEEGVTIIYAGKPHITAEFFAFMLNQLRSKTLKTGFTEDNPTPGGFGEWLQQNTGRPGTHKLTPRHGSHVAAILVHEGYARYLPTGHLSFNP